MPRVLIVDDEPGIRFALKRWFERQHWIVVEADNGESALAQLMASDDAGDDRVDLVICDLHLPRLTGGALVERLHHERPALADRLILSTGDSVHDAPLDSPLAQHPFVLQKPFELATLRALVEKVQRLS